jgi:hypothetical protein
MAVGGTVLAGLLADRMTRNATRGGHGRLLAWSILLAAPFLIALPLAPSAPLALAALAAGLIFYSMSLTLPAMAIQVIAPHQMRGQLVGTLSMLTGLLGYGLGPIIAGLLSDRLQDLPLALATARDHVSARRANRVHRVARLRSHGQRSCPGARRQVSQRVSRSCTMPSSWALAAEARPWPCCWLVAGIASCCWIGAVSRAKSRVATSFIATARADCTPGDCWNNWRRSVRP